MHGNKKKSDSVETEILPGENPEGELAAPPPDSSGEKQPDSDENPERTVRRKKRVRKRRGSSGNETTSDPASDSAEMEIAADEDSEGESAAPPPDSSADEWPDSDANPERAVRRGKKVRKNGGLTRYLPLLVIYGLVLALILSSWYFYETGRKRGVAEGWKQAKATAARDGVKWTTELAAEIDAALTELRQGQADAALARLQKVEPDALEISSISYLIALAALQSGNTDLAEKKALESIDKMERTSDSLALLAVLETQRAGDPDRAKLVDARLRAEQLLRQACLADAANPYPRYELGTLLRYQGRQEEALSQIEAAQARLNPIDSHMIMGITLDLMRIERTPIDQLPAEAAASDDVRKLFPAAYASMRLGNFDQAAALLQKCRDLLPPDVFDYIVYDPAILKFRDRGELRPFIDN